MSDQLAGLKMALDAAKMHVDNLVLPADNAVDLRGLQFHYLEWGDAEAPPIVFLHGGGLTAHTWDLVCAALASKFRCIALDQRGHGDTDWAPDLDYAIATHAADTERFTEAMGLDRFALVGMSLGGLNAIHYASRHAQRLSHLVLVDVGPNAQLAGAKRITDFMSLPSEHDSVEDFVDRAMRFNPRRDPQLLRRSLLHNLRQLPSGKWTWKYDQRHIRSLEIERFMKEQSSLWEIIPSISCPTLVVRGGESDVFSDSDAEKLAESLPDARWIRITGAGHTVQGDKPRDLSLALDEFLSTETGG